MNKDEIIDKIIEDLPNHSTRPLMSDEDWRGWIAEAFDKGFEEGSKKEKELRRFNSAIIIKIDELVKTANSFAGD